MTSRSSRVRNEHTQSFTYKYSGNPTNKIDLVSSIGRQGYLIKKIKTRTTTNILPFNGPWGSDGYPEPKGNRWLIKNEIPSLGHSTEEEGDDSVFMNRSGDVILVCDYARDKNSNKMVGYAQVWYVKRNRDEYILYKKGGILEGSNITNSKFGYTGCINSTGNRIAITELGYNNNTGKVYIYEFDGENNWYLLGSPLIGSNEMEKFGNSLSFAMNGNIIAISAMGYSIRDNNNNIIQKNIGKVSVYKYNSNTNTWELDGDLEIKNTLRKNNGFNGEGGIKLNLTGTKLVIGSLKESSIEASLNDESEPHEGLVTIYENRKVTNDEFFNNNTVYRHIDINYINYFNNIPIGEFTLLNTHYGSGATGPGDGPEYFKFIYNDKNGNGIVRFQVLADDFPEEVEWYIYRGDYENGDTMNASNLIYITDDKAGEGLKERWNFTSLNLTETSWAEPELNNGIDKLLGGNNNEPNPFIEGETYTLVLADNHGDGWNGAKIIISFDDSVPPPTYVYDSEKSHWIEKLKIIGPRYVENSIMSWTETPYSSGERAGHISMNKMGNCIAIGAPGKKWNGNNGRIRVIEYIEENDEWMQLGDDIVGDGEELGGNISLNGSGYFLVTGSGGAVNQSGKATVYYFNRETLNWEIRGDILYGNNNSKLGIKNTPLGGVGINERGDKMVVVESNGEINNNYFENIEDPGVSNYSKGVVKYCELKDFTIN